MFFFKNNDKDIDHMSLTLHNVELRRKVQDLETALQELKDNSVDRKTYDSLHSNHTKLQNEMNTQKTIKQHLQPIVVSIDNLEGVIRSRDYSGNEITIIKYRKSSSDVCAPSPMTLYISSERHDNLVHRITRNDNPNVHTVRV